MFHVKDRKELIMASEMEWKDAIQAVISALPNPEDFDEPLGKLNEAVQIATDGAGEVETWRSKYETLRTQYTERFGETTGSDGVIRSERRDNGIRPEPVIESEPYTLEELFSAYTE